MVYEKEHRTDPKMGSELKHILAVIWGKASAFKLINVTNDLTFTGFLQALNEMMCVQCLRQGLVHSSDSITGRYFLESPRQLKIE